MLQRFPVESKGRRKKLQEVLNFTWNYVRLHILKGPFILSFSLSIYLLFLMQVGYVTTICFSCFLIRCVMVSVFFLFNSLWFLLLGF